MLQRVLPPEAVQPWSARNQQCEQGRVEFWLPRLKIGQSKDCDNSS